MNSSRVVLSTCLALFFAASSFAADRPSIARDGFGMIYGGQLSTSKVARDTVVMIGPWVSGAAANGQFQSPEGSPDWNGWTHRDATETLVSHWQVSDFQADNLGLTPSPGNLAAWCGDINIPTCGVWDVDGGYGNSWNDVLQWVATVANPTLGVEVQLTAYANIDTEPNYDYVHIQQVLADGPIIQASFDGIYTNHFIDVSFYVSPEEYQGENQDQVVIQIAFTSDGAFSDADCMWPTAGAVQIDDITISLEQDSATVTDFTDFQNGLGNWEPFSVPGVGDFSKIWSHLDDLDDCASNLTPQVAFIDDGLVVPGVGPSYCEDWCYGPGGYVVNSTGGRLSPDGHLHNLVESPVVAWPNADLEGAILEADVYQHETLSFDSPGIFYTWGVRSTGSSDPADLQHFAWESRGFLYMGGPNYTRLSHQVSDLMTPGRQFAQVQLAVYELGFVWGIVGNNGTPAPYFDNVNFRAFAFFGPGMASREIDLAQDNFPANGEVDLINLENNSVRFDMAQNISLPYEMRNDPGDSLVVNISSVRAGADMVGNPTLHFKIKQNPLFDLFRTNSEFGSAPSGEAVAYPCQNASGPIPGRWAFDLPDSNFLFPGDVLHYYIRATDDNGFEVQSAIMPADTTGFSDFDSPTSYHSSYTIRALPSVMEDPLDPGELFTPRILFWNDFGNRGGENEWYGALGNLGFVPGRDFDIYYTNGPSSGVGNGLGGRATANSLAGYDHLLYTSGDLGYTTLSNGDFDEDAGDDLGVLDSWLRLGSKNLFLTGDNLANDIIFSGIAGTQFIEDWMGLEVVATDLAPLIHNQSSPKVQVVAGNGVFSDQGRWIAYGGCRFLNRFDAVDADLAGGSIKLAEFLDPNGSPGYYTFSAATLKENAGYDVSVISMPYDFMFIYTDPEADKTNASLATRVILLDQVLGYFGIEGRPMEVTPVPGAESFSLRGYPNPFNPAVKIEYNMPQAGHLSLKVFDVRGQLVRTLIDEMIPASGHIMWDGTDDQGSAVASGVYFYQASTEGQTLVEKLTLIR